MKKWREWEEEIKAGRPNVERDLVDDCGDNTQNPERYNTRKQAKGFLGEWLGFPSGFLKMCVKDVPDFYSTVSVAISAQ
jgi:hypothetical protein